MPQQQSPWLETAYGWVYGEDGWNTGMDSNLLKFSVMFDRNVDSIASTLPPAVNGQVHYNTTDNRLYFAVGSIYYSSPVPKWFTIVVRSTGAAWQFNGSSLISVPSPNAVSSRLDAVELTLSTLGSAAFEDSTAFATPADIDVVQAQTQEYTDELRSELADNSAELVAVLTPLVGGVRRSIGDMAAEQANVYNFGAIGDGTSHPLSERFTTLLEAQAVYPFVEALEEEIDWAACQAAINTGLPVIAPQGIFVLNDELLFTTPGQSLRGEGGGEISVDRKSLVDAKTTFLVKIGTVIPRYRKTRRQAPETALDPDDAPLNCVINNQSERGRFYDFAIKLEVDYGDLSHTNLGADVDVGFFSGCRTGVHVEGVTVHGYSRVADFYFDVTASTALPAYTSNRGVVYPPYHTNGSDQCVITDCRNQGGLKGVFLAGAKWGTGTYYDFISETTYPAFGGRGGSGASDLILEGTSYFQGRDHHSGRRAYDPTMNLLSEDIDAMAAVIAIDGRRGSTTQGRIRHSRMTDIRIKTGEAARIFLGRVAEVDIDWIHTEPNQDITMDTAGNLIDVTDYATHGYGPLACVPTGTGSADAIAREGATDVYCYGVWGTGIVSTWVQGVQGFSNSRNRPDVQQVQVNLADDTAFSFVPSKTFGCNISVATNLATSSGQVFIRAATTSAATIQFGGASLDVSTMALTGTTGTDGKLTISGNGGRIYIENRTGATRPVSCSILA